MRKQINRKKRSRKNPSLPDRWVLFWDLEGQGKTWGIGSPWQYKLYYFKEDAREFHERLPATAAKFITSFNGLAHLRNDITKILKIKRESDAQ